MTPYPTRVTRTPHLPSIHSGDLRDARPGVHPGQQQQGVRPGYLQGHGGEAGLPAGPGGQCGGAAAGAGSKGGGVVWECFNNEISHSDVRATSVQHPCNIWLML